MSRKQERAKKKLERNPIAECNKIQNKYYPELDDDEFLEYCEYGYDTQQIACAMHSHINLVALKGNTLISQGYRLRPQEHRNDFLRFDK